MEIQQRKPLPKFLCMDSESISRPYSLTLGMISSSESVSLIVKAISPYIFDGIRLAVMSTMSLGFTLIN